MLGDIFALGLRADGDGVEHGPVLLHDEPLDHVGHVLLPLLVPAPSLPLSPASTCEPKQIEDGGGKVVHDHYLTKCLIELQLT